jgi:hypothetical protein
MNMSLNTTDFMEDQTFGLQSIFTNETMKSRLYCFVDDWHIAFCVPNEMEIDRGVGASGHAGEAR